MNLKQKVFTIEESNIITMPKEGQTSLSQCKDLVHCIFQYWTDLCIMSSLQLDKM